MSNIVHAEPAKRFFVEMITRDLTLEDAILDLIDNSVDALIRSQHIEMSTELLTTPDSFARFSNGRHKIEIDFDEHEFKISDNCGGIDIEKAKNDVFRFGKDEHDTESCLSVYGIGLKRAIFKLGREIRIESKTINNGFSIDINVDEWKKPKTPWEFELIEGKKAVNSDEAGTTITVKKLNDETIMRLKDGTFAASIDSQAAAAYCLLLNKFVQLSINGDIVRPMSLPYGGSNNVNPSVEKTIEDGVDISIIASLADRIEGEWRIERAGWYIFCNGRAVVFADKTELTGWGDDVGLFQPKHRGFLGLVFFSAKDPEDLPWTTTKRGLNKESHVYQRAKKLMFALGKPVIKFLNDGHSINETQNEQIREIASNIKTSDVSQALTYNHTVFEVKTAEPIEKKTVKIQYEVSKEELEKVKRCLKKTGWSATKIGKYAFDYLIEQECS